MLFFQKQPIIRNFFFLKIYPKIDHSVVLLWNSLDLILQLHSICIVLTSEITIFECIFARQMQPLVPFFVPGNIRLMTFFSFSQRN